MSACSCPKYLHSLRQAWAKSRSLELDSGIPQKSVETQALGRDVLHMRRQLDVGAEPGLEPVCSEMSCGFPRQTKCQPQSSEM